MYVEGEHGVLQRLPVEPTENALKQWRYGKRDQLEAQSYQESLQLTWSLKFM